MRRRSPPARPSRRPPTAGAPGGPTRSGGAPPTHGGPGARSAVTRAPALPPGTTLVELLTVLMVLGVVAAAASPALKALTRPGPGAAAEELTEAYARARTAATSGSQTATVTVDPRSGSWRIFVGSAAREDARDGGNLRTGQPDTRIVVTGGSRPVDRVVVVIRFDARGRARGPDLMLTDGETRRVVSVDPWTGAIRLR